MEARLDSMGGDPDGWPPGNVRCPGTGQSPLWGWAMGEKWRGLRTRRCTRTHVGCACIYGACVWVDGHKIVPCYQCQGMVHAVCGVHCPDKSAAYRPSSVASNIVWGFPVWGSHTPAVSEPLAETMGTKYSGRCSNSGNTWRGRQPFQVKQLNIVEYILGR